MSVHLHDRIEISEFVCRRKGTMETTTESDGGRGWMVHINFTTIGSSFKCFLFLCTQRVSYSTFGSPFLILEAFTNRHSTLLYLTLVKSRLVQASHITMSSCGKGDKRVRENQRPFIQFPVSRIIYAERVGASVGVEAPVYLTIV